VLGISPDKPSAQKKFQEKYKFPFSLLSDIDKTVAKQFGVLKEKSMYGRKYMGTERNTFVIDRSGRIFSIFRKVKPEEHVSLVRDALNELAAN